MGKRDRFTYYLYDTTISRKKPIKKGGVNDIAYELYCTPTCILIACRDNRIIQGKYLIKRKETNPFVLRTKAQLEKQVQERDIRIRKMKKRIDKLKGQLKEYEKANVVRP